jgi:hypothetical protein
LRVLASEDGVLLRCHDLSVRWQAHQQVLETAVAPLVVGAHGIVVAAIAVIVGS